MVFDWFFLNIGVDLLLTIDFLLSLIRVLTCMSIFDRDEVCRKRSFRYQFASMRFFSDKHFCNVSKTEIAAFPAIFLRCT